MARVRLRAGFVPLLAFACSAYCSAQIEERGDDASAARSAGPPNVLVLLADDLTSATLGINDPYILTPNLDRLAAEGVRFTRYAVNHPVCSPSRALLMTGLYAQHNGV